MKLHVMNVYILIVNLGFTPERGMSPKFNSSSHPTPQIKMSISYEMHLISISGCSRIRRTRWPKIKGFSSCVPGGVTYSLPQICYIIGIHSIVVTYSSPFFLINSSISTGTTTIAIITIARIPIVI